MAKRNTKENSLCYQPNGNSVIDYLLVKENNFDKILDFEIGDLNDQSDHSYLSIKLKIKCQDKQKKESNNSQECNSNLEILHNDPFSNFKDEYNCSFKYLKESKNKIIDTLNKDDIRNKLKES